MKTIKQILEAELKDNEASYAEYLALVEFAKPYEGKRITRAIGNKLPAGYKLTDGYSGLEIIAPSGRKHAFIRSEDMGNFTLQKFADFNPPYAKGASERIDKLKLILDNPKKLKECEEYFKGMKKAYDELKEFAKESEDDFGSYENPAFYEILKEWKISNNIISDLRFGKDEEKFEKGGKAGKGKVDIVYDLPQGFWGVKDEKGKVIEKGFDSNADAEMWVADNGYSTGIPVANFKDEGDFYVLKLTKDGKLPEDKMYPTGELQSKSFESKTEAENFAEAHGWEASFDFEKGGKAEGEYGIGDLVFANGVGSAGLVGLVISDLKEEDGESGYDVYFRGLSGDTFFMPEDTIDDILSGHLYLAQDKGDLMHYPNIAKKLGITINSKYEETIAEDEMGKGGKAVSRPYVKGKVVSGIIVADANKEFDDNPLFYIYSEYPTYKQLDKRGYLLYNYEYYTDKDKNKYLVISDLSSVNDAEISELIRMKNDNDPSWGMARNVDRFVEGADADSYVRWLDMISLKGGSMATGGGADVQKKIQFSDFLTQKGFDKWYLSNRPIERYDRAGSKRINKKQYNELEEEYKKLSSGGSMATGGEAVSGLDAIYKKYSDKDYWGTAHDIKSKKEERDYYGMSKANEGDKIYLSGASGLNSMVRILNGIGYGLDYVSGTKKETKYILVENKSQGGYVNTTVKGETLLNIIPDLKQELIIDNAGEGERVVNKDEMKKFIEKRRDGLFYVFRTPERFFVSNIKMEKGGEVEDEIETIADLRRKNEEIGHHFFSPSTMRGFKSKVESDILGGKYFITSEANYNDTKREFTIRGFKPDGAIINNPFKQKFDNKSDAKQFLKSQTSTKKEKEESKVDFWIKMFKPRTDDWREKTLEKMNEGQSSFDSLQDHEDKIEALEYLIENKIPQEDEE